jgi:hypothetical protein
MVATILIVSLTMAIQVNHRTEYDVLLKLAIRRSPSTLLEGGTMYYLMVTQLLGSFAA